MFISLVVFDSIVHRWKDEQNDNAMMIKVGRGVPTGTNIRATSRSAFENGLPVHTPTIESIFDFILSKATSNVEEEEEEDNFSLIMTEAPLIPEYCRQEILELLFEGYNCIDRVAFVLDGPSAACTLDFSLVIHIGAFNTHIYPIIDGAIDWSQVKRINWGGVVAAEFLLKILGLKYPGILNSTNPTRLTSLQAQAIWQRTALVAPDIPTFEAQMDSLSDPTSAALNTLNCCIRLTGDAASESTRKEAAAEAKRAAELNQAALQEKRRILADKLRQKGEEQRAAKLRSKEHIYKALQGLLTRVQGAMKKTKSKKSSSKATKDDEDISMDFSDDENEGIDEEEEDDESTEAAEIAFNLTSLGGDVKLFEELKRLGFKGVNSLQEGLRRAEEDFFRLSGQNVAVNAPSYDFTLLSVPDSELSEVDIREKRRLRLIKSSADARERQKAEKAIEDAKKQAIAESLEWKRRTDLSGWRRDLYNKRTELINKLMRKQKQRADRKGALQGSRFRSVVSLGESNEEPASGPGSSMPSESGPDDGFGLNDDDWLVYRQVSRDEDEDSDLQDQDQLSQIETLLEEKDHPEFMRVLQEEQYASLTLLDRLTFVVDSEVMIDHQQPTIHINSERMRCTEGLFQPLSIQGIDQAGLSEILANLLAAYPIEIRSKLIQNVHVSGGPAGLVGLEERLRRELSMVLLDDLVPLLKVNISSDLEGPWKGIQKRISSQSFNWITREKYFESKPEEIEIDPIPQPSKKKSSSKTKKQQQAQSNIPSTINVLTTPFLSDCSNPY